jgi:hypothetical protein
MPSLSIATRDLFRQFMTAILGTSGDLSPLGTAIASALSHLSVTLDAGDLEIGGVELKNAATDDRAKVAATGSIAAGDFALATQDPVVAASVRAPILGTSVYTAITATTTAMAANLAAGEYLFKVLTGERVTFRINAADATTAAVWATTPGIILEDVYLPVKLSAASRIVAICNTGETATLMTLPVT